jgi:hypothetical protein
MIIEIPDLPPSVNHYIDDEEKNALNGPKTRDKIRRGKTLTTQPERRP